MEQNCLITSKLLSRFNNIKHGFVCRSNNENDDNYNDKVFGLLNNKLILPSKQLHTDNIIEINTKNQGEYFECDAIITKEINIPIGIRTADCVPILMYASNINYIAVIHAGWRSLYLKIIEKVVQKLASLGGKCDLIYTSIGPYIHQENYVVDEKFVNHFTENGRYYANCVQIFNNKFHFNLGQVLKEQLSNYGVLSANIDDVDICTFESESFPSFRRMSQMSANNDLRFYSFLNLVL